MAPLQDSERAVEFLGLALRAKDAGAVAAALRLGAPVDAQDGDGTPMIMNAAAYANADCVRAFLDHGADVNMRDDCGSSILIWASDDENLETAKLLLDRGVDVNVADTVAGSTALMCAAEYGATAMVQLLLERGADTRLKDKRGRTAADIARENGHESSVGLLISAAEKAAQAAAVAARQKNLRAKAPHLKPRGMRHG